MNLLCLCLDTLYAWTILALSKIMMYASSSIRNKSKARVSSVTLLARYINILFPLGIEVATPSGKVLARAMLLTTAVDLPARAILMNMKLFNGKYACVYCEHEGVTEDGNHLHRFWPHRTAPSRSHQSILSNAVEATTTSDVVCTCKINSYFYMYVAKGDGWVPSYNTLCSYTLLYSCKTVVRWLGAILQ